MADAESPRGRRSESLADNVRTVVVRTCGRGRVGDEHSIAHDLHLDEADRVELLMAIELAFRIEFSAGEAATILSVGDLVAAVARKARAAEPALGADEPLLEAIKDLAAGAASTGEAIDVAAAATSLAGEHPHSGLTLGGIREEIERAALAAGATIAAGSSKRSRA